MPEGCSFRLVDEKHVAGVVETMLWSPKMDLIAVANQQGEVLLYRLSWQKVWTLTASAEDVKVTTLAWRPDGKVLATGYNNGDIVLCDVENSEKLHSLSETSSITSLSWIADNIEDCDNKTPTESGASSGTPSGAPSDSSSVKNEDCFRDTSAHYLPRLPQFSKSYIALSKGHHEDNVEDTKRLKDQRDLNILSVGTEDGHICMYAYGIFPVANLDLNQLCSGKGGRVLSCQLSHDLSMLSLLVESYRDDGTTKDVYLVSFDSTLLACRHRELRILSLKFGQVLTLLVYLESTIQQMLESWEDILLEVDSKLMKLAEQKYKSCGGSVSNDFLRLLMIGMPSDELSQFLLMELTEKGLKKLGLSIDASYNNIQKLVLKHLQSVGQAVVYHLADIHGMSLWYDKFGVLGLSNTLLHEAIQAAGSLMLKASELQQVIDGSMRNFKAFFKWLYVVIQRLSEEPVSPELSKMTQQDLNFVAQFLKENFTEEVSASHKQGFKLEKVGQYLREEDLRDLPDVCGNPWVDFLGQNPKVQNSSLLYSAHHDKSLIQMHTLLKTNIKAALNKCADVIGRSFDCVTCTPLYSYIESEEDNILGRVSQYSKTQDGSTHLYTLFTAEPLPCSKCYMLRQNTTGDRCVEAISLEFGEIGTGDLEASHMSTRCSNHTIHDISFYDESTFCVLLCEETEEGFPILAQVPLSLTDDTEPFVPIHDDSEHIVNLNNIPCIDAGPQVDHYGFRRLENMKAVLFAVSGARRVACVLFATRRRVRLFMMDAEDEEEEEDDEEEVDTTTDLRQVNSPLVLDNSMDEGDENKENAEVSL